MSVDINDRLIAVRKHLGMTQEEFGESVGVSRSVIKNIEYKATDPKPLFIQQVCKTHGIRQSWLETGEGEMFNPRTDEQEIALIFGEALAEDGDPRRRKLLMSLINLASSIPDDALPVVCEYAQQIADALKEDT